MLRRLYILFLAISFHAYPAFAGSEPDAEFIELPAIFSDHMVLQRNIPIPIWGTANPGGIIEVTLNAHSQYALADQSGNWIVRLEPMRAGGPYELTITGNTAHTFQNVMIGDVWICSGQSNMEWFVVNSLNADRELADANYPAIRLYTVPQIVNDEPVKTISGNWQQCSFDNLKQYSAVGYFFGRELYKEFDIPIGLINASWGGTPAEAWTPIQALENDPDLKPIVERFYLACKHYDENYRAFMDLQQKYYTALKYWEAQVLKNTFSGAHNIGNEKGLAARDFDDSNWKVQILPAIWEDIIRLGKVVWFRREIHLPAGWIGHDATLSIGARDSLMAVYFNGTKLPLISRNATQYESTIGNYLVPEALIQDTRAVIAVRVTNPRQLLDTANPLVIYADETMEISLKGPWKYEAEVMHDSTEISLPPRPQEPMWPKHKKSPCGLYNAMIHPIIPYAIRGVLWYQGEENVDRAYQYRKLLPALIHSWRHNWQQGDFPFLIVQLANYTGAPSEPCNSTWAELREAQLMTMQNVPNCALAVAIDLGEAYDIHPKNKQDVGKRLSLCARRIVYGQDIVCSGPIYESMVVEGDKIRLKFQNVDGGLVAQAGELKQFAIAGEDKKFVWANARIEGETILVWSDDVKDPIAVRYAWADNPAGCNLYNKAGLPATPFRTDSWKGITEGNN